MSQIILSLDLTGNLICEAPGRNGAPRTKVTGILLEDLPTPLLSQLLSDHYHEIDLARAAAATLSDRYKTWYAALTPEKRVAEDRRIDARNHHHRQPTRLPSPNPADIGL